MSTSAEGVVSGSEARIKIMVTALSRIATPTMRDLHASDLIEAIGYAEHLQDIAAQALLTVCADADPVQVVRPDEVVMKRVDLYRLLNPTFNSDTLVSRTRAMEVLGMVIGS